MNSQFFILVVLCFQLTLSQNLVLNPSFEKYKTCPNRISIFKSSIEDWTTPNTGSTDYFNSCSNTVGFVNFFGEQEARTGNAYAGIYVMAPQNYREYIQAELSDPLITGQKYTVSFYVSLSENCSHAIRDFGVLFLKTPIAQKTDKLIPLNKVLNKIPESHFTLIKSQDYHTDKEGWEKVTFEYVAKGFEKHVVIGNFDENSKIAKVQSHKTNDFGSSYYYIDDVSVLPFKIEYQTKVVSNSIENNQILENDKVYTLQNVLFDFDKHNLLKSSKLELDQLYNYLNANKRLQIEIYGHTDDVGTQKRNDELSLLRAKEVALYLISKGLRPERITATGYGNKFPVANNDTEAGRALNRRVEFKLIFK